MSTVYYSLAADADGTRERQWARSVHSLRRHNAEVRIVLCLYGGARAETFEAARAAGVHVEPMGGYAEALGDIPAHWRDALMSNPTLHKLLSLRTLTEAGAAGAQLIYLDCDTYCFGDIASLAVRYDRWDFCAREEPLTLRSAEGHDWTYIDEPALAALARAEGLTSIPPYNTGVMVLSTALARTLVTLLDDFVWYAWRLLHGACLWRPDLVDDRLTDFVRTRSEQAERRLALPYPAASIWIMEQVATWLILGRVPGLTHGMLARADVAQNGEYTGQHGLTLAHYFTSGEGQFLARLNRPS